MSTRTDNPLEPSGFELTRYFVPLGLQAMTQAMSYIFAAMIASRAAGGTLNFAGMDYSNRVMFLLCTIALTLVTTGMVYGKTKQGFFQFVKVNFLIGTVVVAAQLTLCIPVCSDILFGTLMGLETEAREPASTALLTSVGMNFLFFLRNPFQVCLYINKATGRAYAATFTRIALTLALTPLFIHMKLVGSAWAIICQTIPICFEVAISWYFARPFIKKMKSTNIPTPTIKELVFFTIPMSVGGMFISISHLVLGSILTRAGDQARVLPAYLLAAQLAGGVAYAATKIQPVVIAFPPRKLGDRKLISFSVKAGLVLGLLPLLMMIPGLDQWYYVGHQKLPAADLDLVRLSAFALALFPLGIALRAYVEGVAAVRKKPITILAGQITFMGILVTVGFFCLLLKVPGNLIAPIALMSANLAALGMVVMSLNWDQYSKLPIPPTSSTLRRD